jgi:hypothetical protein
MEKQLIFMKPSIKNLRVADFCSTGTLKQLENTQNFSSGQAEMPHALYETSQGEKAA